MNVCVLFALEYVTESLRDGRPISAVRAGGMTGSTAYFTEQKWQMGKKLFW